MTIRSNRAGLSDPGHLMDALDAQQDERDRARTIAELGRTHDCESDALRAIRAGDSVADFRASILAGFRARRAPAILTHRGDGGEQFGLGTAVRELFAPRGQTDGQDSLRVKVPWHSLRAGTNTSNFLGGVSTEARVDLAAEALRDATVCERLGARLLHSLTGDQEIPLVDGATAAIATETAVAGTEEPTESSGTVKLVPKSGRAFTPISRRIFVQSQGQIEQVVRADLLSAIAELIDETALAAAVAAAEEIEADETGRLHHDVIAARTALEVGKYRPISRGYVLNPLTVGQLSVPYEVGGVAFPPVFVGQPWNGSVNGLPAAQHSSVEHIVYGEFSELFIGLFGPGVELNLGPADNAGLRYLRCFVEFDAKVRRPAFVKIDAESSSSSGGD